MKILFLILVLAGGCQAQGGVLQTSGFGPPLGYCNNARYQDLTTGLSYDCASHVWQPNGAGVLPATDPRVNHYIDASYRGVKADGVTDDWAVIQGLLDEAGSDQSSHKNRTVRLPAGTISLSRPLRIKNQRVALVGDPNGETRFNPVFGSGPTLVIHSGTTSLPVTTSLATGAGGAMVLDGVNSVLVFHDIPTMIDLNGLAAFTAECFLKITAPIPGGSGNRSVLTSSGNMYDYNGTGPDSHAAFDIFITSDFRIGFTWDRISNDPAHEVKSASGVIVLNQTHHVALTFDGTAVRLFLDGAVVASEVRPGTVVQQPFESTAIGYKNVGAPPYGSQFQVAPIGALDSVRFSDSARYTSNFTVPTAKFTSDAHNLLLLNFDNLQEIFVVGQTRNGAAWIMPALETIPAPQIGAIRLEDLHFIGSNGASGLYNNNGIQSFFRRLIFEGCQNGILFDNATYSAVLDDINVQMGQSKGFGIVIRNQSAALSGGHWTINGGRFPLILSGAVGGVVTGLFLTPQKASITSALIKGGNMSFHDFFIDDEGTVTTAAMQASLIVSNEDGNTSFFGGLIMNSGAGGTHPNVVIDGGDKVSFNGTTFDAYGTAPSIFLVKKSPRLKAGIFNASRDRFTNAPWFPPGGDTWLNFLNSD